MYNKILYMHLLVYKCIWKLMYSIFSIHLKIVQFNFFYPSNAYLHSASITINHPISNWNFYTSTGKNWCYILYMQYIHIHYTWGSNIWIVVKGGVRLVFWTWIGGLPFDWSLIRTFGPSMNLGKGPIFWAKIGAHKRLLCQPLLREGSMGVGTLCLIAFTDIL